MSFPINDHTRATITHHFRGKGLVWNEQYFVTVLQTSEQRYDIYWAVIALRDCGTPAAVPALKAKLHYAMQDVQSTALLTIAHIAGSSETPMYAEALLDPKYRQKTYAAWAIRVAADERAVPAVVTYFRKNAAKFRRGALTNGTVPEMVEYLHRFAHIEGASEVLAEVAESWQALARGEQEAIARRVPGFPPVAKPAV